LTASIKQRALRKQKDLQIKNKDVINLFEIMKKIKLRDLKDEKRSIAPLKKAADAILIDSTNLSIEETVNVIENLIKREISVKTCLK
ncbi:MAG: (d)CMP kinase, partial [Candidatus Phytoplasma australasiaticum]|nr:(d)CMP kinase [Candidatus Phytoplasma australasiaticum]